MKVKIIIGVLSLAAAFLTPALATTTITLTTTLPTGTLGTSANLYLTDPPTYTGTSNGYIIANGWDDIFPGTTVAPPNYNSPAAAEALKVGSDNGLGLNNSTDNGQIGITDGIVLDFANVKSTVGGGSISQVTFDLNKDNTGNASYMIYGMSSANGSGTATLLTSGPDGSSGPVTFSTSTVYSSYVIGLTDADCSIDLQSVAVTYSGVTTTTVPEPGTFVMAGMALIVLGVTIKRRQKA